MRFDHLPPASTPLIVSRLFEAGLSPSRTPLLEMKSGFPFSSFRITFSRRPPITFFLYIYIYKIVVIAISSPSYYNFSPLGIDSLLFLRRMCPLTRAATLHTRDFNEAKKGKRLTASATIASHRMYTCVCLSVSIRVYAFTKVKEKREERGQKRLWSSPVTEKERRNDI